MSAFVLNKKIDMLPLHRQKEVADFVDFLLSLSNVREADGTFQTKRRTMAGFMKGSFGKMSDDFNEPLDDFKDYM